MKRIVSLLLGVLFFCVASQAQVQISEDSAVESLLQRHMDQNKMSTTISGWRIQLLATTDRRKVENEESKFIQRYPLIQVNWVHSKPYYKLKAGAFANRLDATRLLKEFKEHYPSALLTKSNVRINEVLN
ncbi:MAG: SPOR domain-containing protein [Saprospiraceae bacterium]